MDEIIEKNARKWIVQQRKEEIKKTAYSKFRESIKNAKTREEKEKLIREREEEIQKEIELERLDIDSTNRFSIE